MKQPWIHSRSIDSLFILLPPFLVLLIIFLFQQQLSTLETAYSFYTWLFLIVFVDVAHVYATLFKTYFIKEEFQKKKALFVGIPIFSLIAGIVLYQWGSLVFWSVLALVAVFHFIRQQYGFMRIYSRFEKDDAYKIIDTITIYTATVFPMLYWFQTPRAFTWFVEHEFDWLTRFPKFINFLFPIYGLVILLYVVKVVYNFIKKGYFNIPKNAIVLGTFLSWYFGIIYFNNDLIFTFLNVITHGVPYIALIYIREINQKENTLLNRFSVLKTGFGVLIFLAIVLGIAVFEEFLWEVLIWKEHISFQNISISQHWQKILVPLLSVPQLTHYLLDGFIWKNNTKS